MRHKPWWAIGLIIALAIVLLSPLASDWPDGLERVAEDQRFMELAEDPLYELIPDYVLPGVENEQLATIVGGTIGAVAVSVLALGVGHLLRVRRSGDQTGQV